MQFNIKGRLVIYERPLVMGIINLSPDSFYSGSRTSASEVMARAEAMLSAGADILDLGGYSSRPGALDISADEELHRLIPTLRELRANFPDTLISIDTFRASLAEACVAEGADIINDIGGGDLDPDMFRTIARLKVPYVLMHMRGTPSDMNTLTDYRDVTADVLDNLAFKCDALHQLGVADVIIDPGFGFAKTLDSNYRLMAELSAFTAIGCPILVGISRKSMIYKELGITPEESLTGTTALNMAALMQGADILRVHDVREAVETVKIYEALKRNMRPEKRLITVKSAGNPLRGSIL